MIQTYYTLSNADCDEVVAEARRRKARVYEFGQQRPDGGNASWATELRTTASELAFQRIVAGLGFDLPWVGVDDPEQPEDFPGINVRCTHYETGHLRVDSKDNDDLMYPLMICTNEPIKIMTYGYVRFYYRGHALGGTVKQERYHSKRDSGPEQDVYMVPQEDLEFDIVNLIEWSLEHDNARHRRRIQQQT